MKSVILTIDTEGHVGEDPVEHLIWGKTKKGERCGIPLIMDICDEVGAKGLFFVDIAEAWDYGEEKIAEVMRFIEQRGHDVGVHIHPDHMADPKRLFLFEYTYDEQYEIIKKCTDFYRKVLGKQPETFRAGKYGANYDTLDILAKLGYKADFSEFYGYDKWCGIQPAVTGNTTVRLENGLLEVPTMSYRNSFSCFFDRYDKLDISMSSAEHSYILKQLVEDDTVNNIVLFAHSFSLLRWRMNPDLPRINKSSYERLKNVLNNIKSNPECRLCGADIIINTHKNNILTVSNAKILHIKGIDSAFFFVVKSIQALATILATKIRQAMSRK